MRHWILLFSVSAAAAAVAPPLAGELSVLASGAVQGAIAALQPALAGEGLRPSIQFETSQTIARRLAAGDTPDVLIAQAAAIDQAVADGKAIAATRASIGRIGIGVAVAAGAASPDVSTVAALASAVSAADLIVVSRGASGAHVETALAAMPLARPLDGRVVREPRGDDVMKKLAASGGRAIGFTMISEIKFGESHGARYVAPLPAAIQTYTPYDVVVMTGSREQEAARAFVRAITTPQAREIFARNGWEF